MKFANTIDAHKWEVAFNEVRFKYRTRNLAVSLGLVLQAHHLLPQWTMHQNGVFWA
jgi:ABC-type proline/glycine betaine transport system ATPase subunit